MTVLQKNSQCGKLTFAHDNDDKVKYYTIYQCQKTSGVNRNCTQKPNNIKICML